jgi:condensin-2 complex subunit D3
MTVSQASASLLSSYASHHSSDSSPLPEELVQHVSALEQSLLQIALPDAAPASSAPAGKKSRTMSKKQGAMFKSFGFATSTQSKTVRSLTAALAELVAHRVITTTSNADEASRRSSINSLDDFVADDLTTALQISPTAYSAATCYAALICVPGSVGTGCVDTAALASIAALMRRWAADLDVTSTSAAGLRRPAAATTTTTKAAPKAAPKKRAAATPTSARKSKRSRGGKKYEDDDEDAPMQDDDDAYDSDARPSRSSSSRPPVAPSTATSPPPTFASGATIANLLMKTVVNPDFASFAPESSEIVIEILTVALAAACSLASLPHPPLSSEQLSSSISESLVGLLTSPTLSLSRRHNFMVFTLRGLLPSISLKLDLPNDQKGKIAAHAGASACLESIVVSLEHFDFAKNADRDAKNYKKELEGLMSDMASAAGGISSIPKPMKFDTSDANTEPRPVLSAICGILQRLACFAVEKLDARTRISVLVRRCCAKLPPLEARHFLKFVMKLTGSKKPVHRMFGIEVVGALLQDDWVWDNHIASGSIESESSSQDSEDDDENGKPLAPLAASTSVIIPGIGERDPATCIPIALLVALAGRVSDTAAGVRTKASQALAEALSATTSSNTMAHSYLRLTATALSFQLVTPLRLRAQFDDRASSRKQAIVALTSVLMLAPPPSIEDIDVLEERCNDPSVATRKAAADGITSLIRATPAIHTTACAALELAWARSVLPLVVDTELTAVNRVMEHFKSIVIAPLVAGRSHAQYRTAWHILSAMSDESRNAGAAKAAAGCLKTALKQTLEGEEDAFTTKLVKHLKVKVLETLGLDDDSDADDSEKLFDAETTHVRNGVWCLFEGLASCSAKPTSNTKCTAFDLVKITNKAKISGVFLTESWSRFRALRADPNTPPESLSMLASSTRSCLRVISKLAATVPVPDAQASLDEIKALLLSCRINPDVIAACLDAIQALTCTCAPGPVEAIASAGATVTELFSRSQTVIEEFINKPSSDQDAIDLVSSALFTIGASALVGFFADDDGVDDGVEKKAENYASQLEWLRGMRPVPPSRLLQNVQVLLPPHLPQISESADLTATPTAIRALAFVTYGKLCLRDGDLAKAAVNVLARELHNEKDKSTAVVRSNALVVLGDLCVRYTNLVDRQLPTMASCMQDSSPLVRRHAILLLSSLLLQDYVKFRGLLIHRYLATLVDEDDNVSQLAEMTLCGPLLTKMPLLFQNSFVESLFVFNNCTSHPVYHAAASSGAESGAVDFHGIRLDRKRRMFIYKLMLVHMSDEQRIGVTARLAKEVLAGALDGGKLEAATKTTIIGGGASVLSDALSILVTSEARVGRTAASEQADADDDEANPNMQVDGPAVAQLAAAKGKLLGKVSKKHMCDIVVPILCSLKKQLEKNKSPLLRQLMVLMVDIMKLYKKEVRETLAGDPVLLKELDFDLRNFDVADKERKEKVEKDRLNALRKKIGGGDAEEEQDQEQGTVPMSDENDGSSGNAHSRAQGRISRKRRDERVVGALGAIA